MPNSTAIPKTWLRSAAINVLALAVGCALAVLLLEVLLRWHNPFQARIKGNRIVLLTNKQYHIRNDVIPSLDPEVTVTRNSLGFRGPNPPADFANYLTIFTVGGSTTQCFFLSDDKTWTARLGQLLNRSFRNLWIDNAGLDGHSSYGHLVLLEDQIRPLHPKIVLFLVGANDVARGSEEEWDAENVKGGISFHSPTAFIKSLSPYSEVASMVANMYRSLNAYRHGLLHQKINLSTQGYLDPAPAAEQQYMSENAASSFLASYQDRLQKLAGVCKENGIEPIFVTQPLLAGAGVDDVTHLDLGRIQVSPGHNGKMWWGALEKYNDVTRRIGQENHVLVIDLAHELPKSSRYFYDFVHFTNEGAQAVAGILYKRVCPVLARQYPGYSARPCDDTE
jgi:lysophospholipase L1-like esterase